MEYYYSDEVISDKDIGAFLVTSDTVERSQVSSSTDDYMKAFSIRNYNFEYDDKADPTVIYAKRKQKHEDYINYNNNHKDVDVIYKKSSRILNDEEAELYPTKIKKREIRECIESFRENDKDFEPVIITIKSGKKKWKLTKDAAQMCVEDSIISMLRNQNTMPYKCMYCSKYFQGTNYEYPEIVEKLQPDLDESKKQEKKKKEYKVANASTSTQSLNKKEKMKYKVVKKLRNQGISKRPSLKDQETMTDIPDQVECEGETKIINPVLTLPPENLDTKIPCTSVSTNVQEKSSKINMTDYRENTAIFTQTDQETVDSALNVNLVPVQKEKEHWVVNLYEKYRHYRKKRKLKKKMKKGKYSDYVFGGSHTLINVENPTCPKCSLGAGGSHLNTLPINNNQFDFYNTGNNLIPYNPNLKSPIPPHFPTIFMPEKDTVTKELSQTLRMLIKMEAKQNYRHLNSVIEELSKQREEIRKITETNKCCSNEKCSNKRKNESILRNYCKNKEEEDLNEHDGAGDQCKDTSNVKQTHSAEKPKAVEKTTSALLLKRKQELFPNRFQRSNIETGFLIPNCTSNPDLQSNSSDNEYHTFVNKKKKHKTEKAQECNKKNFFGRLLSSFY